MKSLLMILCLFSFSLILAAGNFSAPEWSKGLSIYEVNIRQYTPQGTFSAFREHLPRLQQMGAGILWLMPVNPIGKINRKGTLGSYYSISDYTALNPEFGSEDDLRALVNEVHQRGMYIIIDWVANHTAWDHVWTIEHPEFYKVNSKGEFYPPVADWSDVIQLDYSQPGLQREMITAMRYWVEEFAIDGFRCDVAEMVPLNFWINARKELEKIKPVFMLAECENPAYHDAFDMTYAWSAFQLFKDIASGDKSVIDIDAYLMRQRRLWDPEDLRMLFLSNHDENSWSGSMLDHFPDSYQAFTVLSYALHGMPLIYSGQEALNNRKLKFFDKDEIEWKSTDMEELYTQLNMLKKDQSALFNGLWAGETLRISNDAPYDIYSVLRKGNDSQVLFVINLSDQPQNVKLRGITGDFHDQIHSREIHISPDSSLEINPYNYLILMR